MAPLVTGEAGHRAEAFAALGAFIGLLLRVHPSMGAEVRVQTETPSTLLAFKRLLLDVADAMSYEVGVRMETFLVLKEGSFVVFSQADKLTMVIFGQRGRCFIPHLV